MVDHSVMSELLHAILLYLRDHSIITAENYIVQVELINLLFVLFSTTLYGGIIDPQQQEEEQSEPVASTQREHNVALEALIQTGSASLVSNFVFLLLDRYVQYCTTSLQASKLQKDSQTSLQKTFSAFTGAASSIIYMPVSWYKAMFGSTEEQAILSVVGKRSLLLLLFVLFYRKNETVSNPFMHAFKQFANKSSVALANIESGETMLSHSFDYDYDRICSALTRYFNLLQFTNTSAFEDEEASLFVYLLLNDNMAFADHVLSTPASLTKLV